MNVENRQPITTYYIIIVTMSISLASHKIEITLHLIHYLIDYRAKYLEFGEGTNECTGHTAGTFV